MREYQKPLEISQEKVTKWYLEIGSKLICLSTDITFNIKML